VYYAKKGMRALQSEANNRPQPRKETFSPVMKLPFLFSSCTVPSTFAAFLTHQSRISDSRNQIRQLNGINKIAKALPRPIGKRILFRRSCSRLQADKSGDGGDSDIDAMRKILEASWNVETMGDVPSSPENAAECAGKPRLNTI